MDTSKRPSPSQHASQTPVGTKMMGNDGNMWEVVADKNGTHRWVRVDQKSYSGGKRYYKPSASSSFSKGDLLMTKNGWEFYKKTLPDQRIVYTISKLAETPQNKTDWEAIKGEMLTSTGFKWGRFSSFEKWGQIASEEAVLKMAADILGKYFTGKSDTNQPPQTPAPTPSGKKIFDANKIANDLLKMHEDAWDVADVSSGSELYTDQAKQKMYIKEMDKFISEYKDYNLANLSAPEWQSVSDIITDANAHSLNNYLALRSYYGKDDYRAYVDLYNKYPNLQLNPANFVSEPQANPSNNNEQLPFKKGDLFRYVDQQDYVYSINNIENGYVFGGWSNTVNKRTDAYPPIPIQQLKNDFQYGNAVLLEKDKKTDSTSSGAATKEQLEKAIKGLKILADKGNTKAIAAMKGLNYLLSKK